MTLLRTTRLMAGLMVRRFLNRMAAGLRRKKKPQERTGTGRKPVGSIMVMLYLLVMIGFGAVSISSNILRSISAAIGPIRDVQGRVEILKSTYRDLQALEVRQHATKSRVSESRMIFWSDGSRAAYPLQRLTAHSVELQAHYRVKGLSGFVGAEQDRSIFLPELSLWQRPEAKPILLRAVGMVLLLIAVWRYFFTLGSANQDLGKVEWSTEWFFTFPVLARHLFAAQILGLAVVDPLGWMVAFPFLIVLFHSTGMGGWTAVPAALCGTLYLSLVMATLHVSTEIWLRKRLAPARIKNLQALFTLLGVGAMLLLFILGQGGGFCLALVNTAQHGSQFWGMNLFSLPAELCAMSPGLWVALQVALAATVLVAAVKGCEWLVRDGLIATTGVYSGKRGRSKTSLNFLPTGIIGKDIRLLLRDRNFLVQALVAPMLMVGFQVYINGSAQLFSSNFQHAATFAFGLGAYVLVTTALSVLSVEGNSVWMLFALPVPIHRIMLRKTFLWAGCALVYTVVTLAVCAHLNNALKPVDLVYAAMACAGVIIYAFIASGIGMLGTDPLETEVKRRIRIDMVYLYMFLAAMFGYAIYAPSAWTRLVQLTLSSLLAYALWQKVRDRSPYLLDPVSAPPQQVSLADGLIAALAFFVLQGVITIIALAAKLPMDRALVVAFGIAGLLVFLSTLLAFRTNLRALFALGASVKESVGRSLGIGVLAGIGAATFGVTYVAAVQYFPALQQLRSAAPMLDLHGGWLVLLAVVAAPLTEEFIFRGLVFGGMRRSLPLAVAVLGSAVIFAICHPPFSVLPVFVMGVFAALSFERTGRLVAPMATHLVYNAVVLLMNRWI